VLSEVSNRNLQFFGLNQKKELGGGAVACFFLKALLGESAESRSSASSNVEFCAEVQRRDHI
jgi:hypothetical protein